MYESIRVLANNYSSRLRPSTNIGYKNLHESFERNSNQQTLLTEVVKKRLGHHMEDLKPQTSSISYMSIGSGSGMFDLPLIDSLGDLTKSFLAIDPNETQILAFREKLMHDLNVFKQENQFTSQTTTFEESQISGMLFDIITCIHVMYYTESPEVFFKKIISSLRPQGIAFIAIAPYCELNQLAQIFHDLFGIPSFYSDQLNKLIAKFCNANDFEVSQKRLVGKLDIGSIEEPNKDIRSFAVQADIDSFPVDLKDIVYRQLDKLALEKGEIDHPVDVFMIKKL